MVNPCGRYGYRLTAGGLTTERASSTGPRVVSHQFTRLYVTSTIGPYPLGNGLRARVAGY